MTHKRPGRKARLERIARLTLRLESQKVIGHE